MNNHISINIHYLVIIYTIRFQQIKYITGGEIGSHEIAGSLGKDYPDNVWANSYELWYDHPNTEHSLFQEKLEPSVGLFREAEPRKHAHGPKAPTVSGGVNTSQLRILAREALGRKITLIGDIFRRVYLVYRHL